MFQEQNQCNQKQNCQTSRAAAAVRIARLPLRSAIAADEIHFSGAQQTHQQPDPAENQQSQTAAAGTVIAAYG